MPLLLPTLLGVQSWAYNGWARRYGLVDAAAEGDPRQEHVRLVQEVTGAVWRRHFPQGYAILAVAFDRPLPSYDPDVERDPLGGYNAETRYIRINPGRISGWRLTAPVPLTYVELLVLTAAHEAMHAVQDARGDPAAPSSDPDGRLRADYDVDRHERECRVEAWRYFAGRWPDRYAAIAAEAAEVPDAANDPYFRELPEPGAYPIRGRRVLPFVVEDRDLPIRQHEAAGFARVGLGGLAAWQWIVRTPVFRGRWLWPRYPLRYPSPAHPRAPGWLDSPRSAAEPGARG